MTTTTKPRIDVPPRNPRPRAIDRADRLVNDRLIDRTWMVETIERTRDRIAMVDHYLQGGDVAGARAAIVDADIELDIIGRCVAGDVPGAEALADSIVKRSKT
jgi:hypothetical protein